MTFADLKEKAREFRKLGWSTPMISKELGVAKSSAYEWTKDIPISEEQRKKFFKHDTQTAGKSISKQAYVKRLLFQEVGRKEIDANFWEHAAGCMLWWCEGSKTKNAAIITNCDCELLKFFVNFLKKYFDVKDTQFTISVGHHGNFSDIEIGEYWKGVLGLPSAALQKFSVKEKKSCETKWPYGVCRVQVNSTELVNRIWGSVQGYMGFERPNGIEKVSKNSKNFPFCT